jgi:hypothetical protein
MKTLQTLFFCVLFGIFCASCANVGQVKITPETGAVLVRISVMAGVAPVLNNNPRYIPAAEALATGISAALTSNPTITSQLIGDYVYRVCKQNGVSDSDIPLFATLAETIYDTYVATYKPAVISSTDPNALLYIYAFRDGMLSAAAIASARK